MRGQIIGYGMCGWVGLGKILLVRGVPVRFKEDDFFYILESQPFSFPLFFSALCVYPSLTNSKFPSEFSSPLVFSPRFADHLYQIFSHVKVFDLLVGFRGEL